MSHHHHKHHDHECSECHDDSCRDKSKTSCGCSKGGCCESCKCGCQKKCKDSCNSQSCSDHHVDSECCKEFAEHLLEVADSAWMNVLQAKIEDEIESHCGSQLEEIARVVSCANKARWKHKMAAKRGCSEYSAALAKIFHKE